MNNPMRIDEDDEYQVVQLKKMLMALVESIEEFVPKKMEKNIADRMSALLGTVEIKNAVSED